MSWYATDERCPEWPYCTGHPGPTPRQREAERLAAVERVRIKRAIRRLIGLALARGVGLS